MEDFSKQFFKEDIAEDSRQESIFGKKKTSTARKIGAFAKRTTANTNLEHDTQRRRPFSREEDKQASVEHTPEKNERNKKDTEAIKKEVALAHINEELAARHKTNNPAEQAAREFLQAVKERLESTEESVDPLIEAEAQARLAAAEQEVASKQHEAEAEAAEEPVLERDTAAPLFATPSRNEQEPATLRPSRSSAPSSISTSSPSPSPWSPPQAPIADSASRTAPLPMQSDFAPTINQSRPEQKLPRIPTNAARAYPFSANTLRTPGKNEQPTRPGGSLASSVTKFVMGESRQSTSKSQEASHQSRESLEKDSALSQHGEITKKLLEDREHAIRKAAVGPSEFLTAPMKESSHTSQQAFESPTTTPPTSPYEALATTKHEASSSSVQKTIPKEHAPEAKRPKNIEQLSTPELLKEAEHIYIDGASVRTLYNTNRLDRSGLIKIVKESLQGGDIAATFEKVELGRERQRERANEFRHDDDHLDGNAADTANTKSPLLGKLLVQDVVPNSEKDTKEHPKLHIPENATSPELDATHEVDQSPSTAKKASKATLTITALLAIFGGAALAILLFG